MPDKTHGEQLRELQILTAALTERMDNLGKDIDRHEDRLNQFGEALSALSTRVALLEHQVGDLRQVAEQRGRRWWALVPAIIGAVIGGSLTFLGQLLIAYLRR